MKLVLRVWALAWALIFWSVPVLSFLWWVITGRMLFGVQVPGDIDRLLAAILVGSLGALFFWFLSDLIKEKRG